jgi:hypothetical protein
MTDNKLKLVTDAPSILTVLDAVTQAQAVLAGYIEPSAEPRDPEATLRKLLANFGRWQSLKAVDALLPEDADATQNKSG